MQPKWHIAYCNVTITEYAGVTYRDYYGSPAVMLEAQLAAWEVAEKRFGVGRFIHPFVDSPPCTFASYLGMQVVEPEADELPYVDTANPVVRTAADVGAISAGDPRTEGLMARRWEAWQYYRAQGYEVGFGGHEGGVVTQASEVTGGAIFADVASDPAAAARILDAIVAAEETVAAFDLGLRGERRRGCTYIGDDYAGLVAPKAFRSLVAPRYQRLFCEQTDRFLHSELLHAEHLRIARAELAITEFHGAGCRNLELHEMREIMGDRFWAQVTPQEMLEMSPAELDAHVTRLADSGAGWVQLYPGRGVPDANMDAAIAACRRECTGGPAW